MQCVVHSPLILGMPITLSNILGTCIVRRPCESIYFACTERLFNLSAEATVNVLNANPFVRCAILPLKNRQIRFPWSLVKGFICVKRQKSVQDVIGDACCPTCPNAKCVNLSTNKTSSFYVGKKYKARSHLLNIPFKDRKTTIILFGGGGNHCLARKTSCDYKRRKQSSFLEKFLQQWQSSTPELEPKEAKIIPIIA